MKIKAALQKVAAPFRPFRLATVWIMLATMAVVALTVWWWTAVESSINYRLAWLDSWQVWLVIGTALLVMKLLPTPVNGEVVIRELRFAAVIILVAFGSMVSYHWVTEIMSGVNAFNASKAHVSAFLLLTTASMLVWSIYHVYRNYQYQQLLERRSKWPSTGEGMVN